MDRPNMLPLFAYADYGPVVVTEGSIMLPSGTTKGSDATLRWAGRSQRLSAAQSVRDLTADFWSANDRWFWQRLEESLCAAGYHGMSVADLRRLPDQLAVIHFACNELIPRIRKLVGEPESEGQRIPDPSLAKAVCARSIRLLSVLPESYRAVSEFWSSMPEHGWAIIDGQVYDLVPRERTSWLARAGYGRGHVKTSSASFLLKPRGCSSRELSQSFWECAQRALDSHARACWPAALRAHLEMEQVLAPVLGLLCPGRPGDPAKTFLYDSPTWKVFRQGSEWYLGLAIGPYGMEDSGRNIYAMDPTTLLMPLFADLGVAGVSVEAAGYQHPFVRPGGRDICMGDYGMREAAPIHRPAMLPADRMLAYMMDVRQTVLAGYHQGNPLRPYRHLSELGHRIISREAAQERKLPIYPYYRR